MHLLGLRLFGENRRMEKGWRDMPAHSQEGLPQLKGQWWPRWWNVSGRVHSKGQGGMEEKKNENKDNSWITTGENWSQFWSQWVMKEFERINLNILSFRSRHYSFSLSEPSFCSATAAVPNFCSSSMVHVCWGFKKLRDQMNKCYGCSTI